MNVNPKSVGILLGNCSTSAKEICRSLADAGISAVVLEKEGRPAHADNESHWSGKPGQDLFFNGWKLLF